jgi:FkbM family methyltransferase
MKSASSAETIWRRLRQALRGRAAPTPVRDDGATVRSGALGFAEIRTLVGRDDPVVVEIGANNGTHTSLFLDTFPHGRVHCFEADARAARKWRQRVTDSRASLTECVVSSVDGEIAFHPSGGTTKPGYPEGWDLSGSIRRPKLHLERWPDITFDRTIVLPSVRLDTWATAERIDRVDFLWMDVQGAESDVIAGAGETLRRTRYLFTEYYDVEMYEGQVDLAGIRALLPGFDLVARFRRDALFRRRKG